MVLEGRMLAVSEGEGVVHGDVFKFSVRPVLNEPEHAYSCESVRNDARIGLACRKIWSSLVGLPFESDETKRVKGFRSVFRHAWGVFTKIFARRLVCADLAIGGRCALARKSQFARYPSSLEHDRCHFAQNLWS
jgi:hypothetical protein